MSYINNDSSLYNKNRRSDARVIWHSRAVLCGVTSYDGQKGSAENLLLEVCTNNVSASGVRIIGSRLLRVGLKVCVRMGRLSGLAVSAQGRVVRCISGKAKSIETPQEESPCNWGIAFAPRDAKALRRHRVFEFERDVNSKTSAVLVSADVLELFWWFSRLSKDVRVVFVATSDERVLQQMRKMAPVRVVIALGNS